jgi:hypothetical protein
MLTEGDCGHEIKAIRLPRLETPLLFELVIGRGFDLAFIIA